MKKQTLYYIAVSILFLVFGSMTASAQSGEYLMTIQVPFAFQVNEQCGRECIFTLATRA